MNNLYLILHDIILFILHKIDFLALIINGFCFLK